MQVSAALTPFPCPALTPFPSPSPNSGRGVPEAKPILASRETLSMHNALTPARRAKQGVFPRQAPLSQNWERGRG